MNACGPFFIDSSVHIFAKRSRWIPLDEQRILNTAGLAHHLALVHAAARTLVQLNGRRERLAE
jgi:hypothetical protein